MKSQVEKHPGLNAIVLDDGEMPEDILQQFPASEITEEADFDGSSDLPQFFPVLLFGPFVALIIAALLNIEFVTAFVTLLLALFIWSLMRWSS